MSKTIFHAVPAMRCHCPAKHFRNAQAALQYARKASAASTLGVFLFETYQEKTT